MMKTVATRFNIRLYTGLILLFLAPDLSSQTFTDRIREVKSFKAGKMVSVEIDNKYGKIHVVPWTKDSVRIEAELFVGSNNLSRMERTKNSIRFDFTSTQYYITARTNFGSGSSQFFTDLKGLTGSIIPGSASVEINYTVHCPANVNLTLLNKFGDIYIDDLKGDIKISLSNGDLKINSHEGKAQIELNFGTGIINHLTDANLSVSYSDLLIRNADNLIIDSKSSTLNLNECEIIRLDSRRDKYFFTNVHSLNAKGFFTQFWVETLGCEVDAQMKFGNMHITKVARNFCKINLSSEFSDISLSFENGNNYEADIFYHPDVSISLPQDIEEMDTDTILENPSQKHKKFRVGLPSTSAKVRINALQKCFININ